MASARRTEISLDMPTAGVDLELRKGNAEIVRIVALPDVQAKIEEVGFVPVGNSSEEFSRYIATEMDTWTRVIKQNDIKVD